MGAQEVTVNVFGAALLPAAARKATLIREACQATLRLEGVGRGGELNVIFVDRRRMLQLNRKFLSHSRDTDVIAFEYQPDPRSGDAAPFGDIYISARQARRQARELGHSVLAEVLTLAIHGALHLVGYDDATPRQKAAMFRKQEALLAGVLRPKSAS